MLHINRTFKLSAALVAAAAVTVVSAAHAVTAEYQKEQNNKPQNCVVAAKTAATVV